VAEADTHTASTIHNEAEARLPRVRGRGLRRYIGPKRVLLLVLLAITVLTAGCLRKEGLLQPSFIGDLIQHHPVSAPLAFVAIYAVALLSALPTLPVNLAAGVFWGPIFGGALSTVATTLAAMASFVAVRFIIGQPLAGRFENRLVAEIQHEFAQKGWVFLAFVRVNPIFPTGPLNYIFGLTSIDTFTYLWVTFAFNLLPSMAVAWIGHSVGTFIVEGEIANSLKMVLGVSAGITVLTIFAYAASIYAKAGGGSQKSTSNNPGTS